MAEDKLTPEEDAELRRLTYFQELGWELAPAVDEDRAAIRARDKRAFVREPADEVVIEEVGKPLDDVPEGLLPEE